jgi:hypothetical protein
MRAFYLADARGLDANQNAQRLRLLRQNSGLSDKQIRALGFLVPKLQHIIHPSQNTDVRQTLAEDQTGRSGSLGARCRQG